MTQSWQTLQLDKFTPNVAPVTLAADPDGILREERLQAALRRRGFALLVYTDPLTFRYLYESQFRAPRDQGEAIELVVSVPLRLSQLDQLPSDILQIAHQVSLSVADLFPKLSAPVISSLDHSDLETLYAAYQQSHLDTLGDDATKAFILQHVFEINSNAVNQPEDLLKVLLRHHYRRQVLPPAIEHYLVQRLLARRQFQDWPLAQLLGDRSVFLNFLQERWPRYLDEISGEQPEPDVREQPDVLYVTGPALLPFDHDDVRVYIDNYFVEGLLAPVEHPHATQLSRTWASYGLVQDPRADLQRRRARLAQQIDANLPAAAARYQDWLNFAPLWAQWNLLRLDPQASDPRPAPHEELVSAVDARFLRWLLDYYPSLYNQPPSPPVMVHHIPTAMRRLRTADPAAKLALIVVDGMGWEQWLLIRRSLQDERSALPWREQAAFAWIPTLTSVSRQSIFAGKTPNLFADTITTTNTEAKAWQRFWEDAGVLPHQILYQRRLGTGPLEDIDEALTNPHLRIAGLVVDSIDQMMHGAVIGAAGFHSTVSIWAQTGYLRGLLTRLTSLGFHVWITADHGNIEARGCGRPGEGALADLRGERVRVYPNATLLSQVHSHYRNSLPWPPHGLPDDFLPLVLTDRSAFVPQNSTTVTHGGIALEEVIVPLILMEPQSQ